MLAHFWGPRKKEAPHKTTSGKLANRQSIHRDDILRGPRQLPREALRLRGDPDDNERAPIQIGALPCFRGDYK